MKIRKWVLQAENGKFLSYDKKGRVILTAVVGKAVMENTKKDIMVHFSKSIKTSPKRLTFELVDKPTGKPAIYRWAVQVADDLGRIHSINGWYANYDKYDNAIFFKDVRKAILYDNEEDARCFNYSYAKLKPKKLVFELVE
jgi:hypothetical protein